MTASDSGLSVRGDLLTVDGTPKIIALGVGAANAYLRRIAADLAWSGPSAATPAAATAAGTAGTAANPPSADDHGHPQGFSAASGTFAAIPAAAGRTGWLYFATDLGAGQLFRSTGAAWVPMGPSAAIEMAAVTTFTGSGQAAGTDVTLWAPGTIPAASMAVGTTYAINVTCDMDIISVITARNLVFKLKLGATTVWTTTQVITVSTGQTNVPLQISAQLMAAVAGVGGSVRSQLFLYGFTLAGGLTPKLPSGGSTGTNAVAVDLSAAQAVTLTVNESVNSVADVVRAQTGTFAVMGA